MTIFNLRLLQYHRVLEIEVKTVPFCKNSLPESYRTSLEFAKMVCPSQYLEFYI